VGEDIAVVEKGTMAREMHAVGVSEVEGANKLLPWFEENGLEVCSRVACLGVRHSMAIK
jgi:effector-binding domain-containing protein